MRFLLLSVLSACYVGYSPGYYDRGGSSSYAQAPDQCDRPSAPTGPTGHKALLCEACRSDDDCAGEGSLCLASGECGKKCVVDCDCPATYECRGAQAQATRQCVPESGECPKKPECLADSDCTDNKICEADKCVAKCTTDALCGVELRCFEDGRCGKACCFDTDCTAGQACKVGRCEKP